MCINFCTNFTKSYSTFILSCKKQSEEKQKKSMQILLNTYTNGENLLQPF